MFKILGLNKQQPFIKKMQPQTVEAENSKIEPLGDKPKWSRPDHSIERNELAKVQAKIKRN